MKDLESFAGSMGEYGQRQSKLKERFEEFEKNAEYNQLKVIQAMQ